MMRHELAETSRWARADVESSGVMACREWCCRGGSLRLARVKEAGVITPALEELPPSCPLSAREARARPSLLKGWTRRGG